MEFKGNNIFSIITPVFDDLPGLKNIYKNLVNLNFFDSSHHWIIIDGSSSTAITDFYNELTVENQLISLISEDDSGIYDALNKGIMQSSSAYFQILNCGTKLLKIPNLIAISESNTDILFGSSIINGNTMKRISRGIPKNGDTLVHTESLIFRRIFFLENKLFDTQLKISADLDFIYRINSTINSCILSNELLIDYTDGWGISGSKKFLHTKILEQSRIIKKHSTWWQHIKFRIISHIKFTIKMLLLKEK